MNFKATDVFAILSYAAAAVALGIPEAVGTLIDTVLGIWNIPPGYGDKIAKALGAACLLAGLLVRLYTNKTGAPTQAIIQNPLVVADDTQVVHAGTQAVGTNLVAGPTGTINLPASSTTIIQTLKGTS